MLTALLIYLMSSATTACPTTVVINKTGTWTEFDTQTLERVETKCVEKYGEQSPCLHKFYKFAERRYGALCGPPLESEE